MVEGLQSKLPSAPQPPAARGRGLLGFSQYFSVAVFVVALLRGDLREVLGHTRCVCVMLVKPKGRHSELIRALISSSCHSPLLC